MHKPSSSAIQRGMLPALRPGRIPTVLFTLAVSVSLVVVLGACASTPPPTAQMAVATAALTHAIGAGANEAAPADIRSARDKLDRAKAALAAKDNGLALTLAQEALVDAQLAEARAHAIKANQAAETVQEGNKALREEMQRKAN